MSQASPTAERLSELGGLLSRQTAERQHGERMRSALPYKTLSELPKAEDFFELAHEILETGQEAQKQVILLALEAWMRTEAPPPTEIPSFLPSWLCPQVTQRSWGTLSPTLKLVRHALEDESIPVRRAAVRCLGIAEFWAGSSPNLPWSPNWPWPFYWFGLEDSDPLVRKDLLRAWVIWTLNFSYSQEILDSSQESGEFLITALQEILNHFEEIDQQNVLELIYQFQRSPLSVIAPAISWSSLYPRVAELLQNSSPAIRIAAVRVLLQAGAEQIPALLLGLKDSEPAVRRYSLRALAPHLAEIPKDVLEQLRHDPAPVVHWEAVKLLDQPLDFPALNTRDEISLPSVSKLYDPSNTGHESTCWLKDPGFYPASERIIFYSDGKVETIDEEDEIQTFEYKVTENKIIWNAQGATCSTHFQVRATFWPDPESPPQACYALILHNESQPSIFFAPFRSKK